MTMQQKGAETPPTRIAGCAIEREIGRGASGVVYLARDANDERVALKVLHRESLDAPGAVARFEREARALRAVHGAALAPLVLAGRLDDGRPYLATRWVEGETLRAHLATCGRIEPVAAWRIIARIAEALTTAHDAGVIHRDLKPENVIIDRDGHAHLIDFGIARTPRDHTDQKLTATGTPLGTPAYMSPEQWWNQSVDAATDQYALGVLAFEMLSGRLPFAEARYVAMMQAHLAADPPSLASVGMRATPGVEAWIARLLAKDPRARFASMREAIARGEEAFEARAAASDEAPAMASLAIACFAPVGLVAIGYVGSHDPRLWARIAGWGVFPVLAAWLGALVALALRRTRAAMILAAATAMLGSFGTYAGWLTVLRALGRFPTARHFEVFNDGMSEANANRFIGFGLACGVALAIPTRTRWKPSRDGVAMALACMLFGSAALAFGGASAAFVAFAAAVAAMTRGAVGPTRNDVIRAETVRIAALVAAVACAFARVEAREAVLWAAAPTRSARVAEIAAASAERSLALAASLASFVAVCVTAFGRMRRAPRSATPLASRASLIAYGLGALLFFVADVSLHARIRERRETLWAAMAPRFALFARLDPPAAGELPPPSLASSLQITRDVVAIDGERIALTAGLASDEGRAALAIDLAHRLARADTGGNAALSVMVDRHVPFAIVRSALRVARRLGVERVDVLFTRGESPTWRVDAPDEAGFALPRDFGAATITLSGSSGLEADDAAPWSRVAPELLADASRTVRVN